VEEDDYSISLELNPKVTEFEGFMEYGGPSIAISGGRTVTVPPGFFQPVFSVREVSTRVTIWLSRLSSLSLCMAFCGSL
jgi:general secretion pathway protein D